MRRRSGWRRSKPNLPESPAVRLIPIRLAPKLNLSLLVFMLVLGAAVATLVLFGFRRTQHNATSESTQRLEQQGREVLLGFANLNAYIGQTQFAATSGIGQEAARYLVETKQQGASIPWDSGTLALTSDGQRYDADPARRTDVRVPAGVPADVADRDLRDSAALDAVFPPLLANFGAAPGDKSIGPISIYFRSVNNVLREYPAIGGGGGALSATGEPAVPPGLDPQANPGRRTVWSAPHAGIGTPGQVMTSYTPVYDGDEFRGVIGVDISLQRLVEQINGIGVTPNGFAFYLGADGSILRSAAYDRIQTALAGAPNGGLAQTVAAMRGGGNGVGRIQLNGRDMYIAYSPLTGVGGSLALVSPVSDVTAQAAAVDSAISREGNQTLIFTLATMAGFLVVALAGGAWMYRRMLLAPISGLVRGTQAVTEGDLNVRIPVRSSDELGMLADSFNRMTQQIEQRRMALRDEISERERTAEALREREEQYRSVFESTTDGLIIAELGGTVAEVNPAACAMHGYTREEFLALPPRAHIAPEFHPLREEMVEQVTAGGEFRTRSRNVRKDGSTFPTEVLGTVLTYRGRPHVLAVVRDITEQVEAERVLEQRVRDRTNEIATLLEITQNIGSTLELRPLLDVILLQVKRVVNFDLAAFLLVQGREVNVLAVNTQHASDVETLMRVRIPVEESSPLWQALSRGEAVNLGDLGADSAIARSTRSGMRGRVGPTATRVRSWLGVPLLSKGQLIGMLAITSEPQDFFGETDVQLAMAVAGQAAFAVESARLFEQTQERTKELATLLEVAAHVGSTLELRPLAQRILQETAVVIGYDRATFALAEDGMLEVVAVHAAQGPADAGLLEQIGERYPVGGEPLVWDELLAGRPVIVDDTHDDSPLAQAYRAAVGPRHVARSQGRNWMAVPLTLQGKLSVIILMS
jgi:PAS domain S-box-containing protein